MSINAFEAFREEIASLGSIVASYEFRTIRDEILRERFRTLFRTWASVVRPEIENRLASKKDLFKLEAEIEALAKLTLKIRPIEDYRKHLNRANSLAKGIVLYLPPTHPDKVPPRLTVRESLFIAGIPDLPTQLVPNPLIGWRSAMETFVRNHPFDRSVFIMIRYRARNAALITNVKRTLSSNGFNGIVASEHNLTGDLYNPVACLLCCSRGIAIFDQVEANQEFNPNVAYELGMMYLLGRDVLILKHDTLQSLHTDILMRLYIEYDSPDSAAARVNDWIDSQHREG